MGKQSSITEAVPRSDRRHSTATRQDTLTTRCEGSAEPSALVVVHRLSTSTSGTRSSSSSTDMALSCGGNDHQDAPNTSNCNHEDIFVDEAGCQESTSSRQSSIKKEDRWASATLQRSVNDTSNNTSQEIAVSVMNGSRRTQKASIQQINLECTGAPSQEPSLPVGAHAMRSAGDVHKLSAIPAGSNAAISRQAHKAPRLSLSTRTVAISSSSGGSGTRILWRPGSSAPAKGLGQTKAHHSQAVGEDNFTNVVDVDDMVASMTIQRQRSNKSGGKSFSKQVIDASSSMNSGNTSPVDDYSVPGEGGTGSSRSLTTKMVSARLVSEDDPEAATLTDEERNALFEQAQKDAEEAIHEKMVRNMVLAEAVVEEDDVSALKRRRRRWCLAGSLLIIIFSVGSLAGSRPWNHNDEGDALSSDDFIPPPVNDLCTGAVSMAWDTESQFQEGTTLGATDSEFPYCTSGDGDATWGKASVWYSIHGNGIPLRVSAVTHSMFDEYNQTIPWDVELSIFTGDCGSLSCVDNTATNQDGLGEIDSAVTWFAESGVEYFVCVHAPLPRDAVLPLSFSEEKTEEVDTTSNQRVAEGNGNFTRLAAGNFSLTIDPAISNDFCPGAIDVEATRIGSKGNTGTILEGSTRGSTIDMNFKFCGGTEPKAGGVWFRAIGTGNPLHVRIKPYDGGFNTQVTVFQQSGDDRSCNLLECIAGGNEVFRYSSQVTWPSAAGMTYYILVHGVSSTGDFELSIEETVANDVCEGSIALTYTESTLATRINGTTKDASPILPPPVCGHAVHSGAGVWFSLVGTGREMHASTCDVENRLQVSHQVNLNRTAISVFQGYDCANLECIDGDDASTSCSTHGAVTWDSEAGQVYHILVSGQFDEIGSFHLSWGSN